MKTLTLKLAIILITIFSIGSCTKNNNQDSIQNSSNHSKTPNTSLSGFSEASCQSVIYSEAGNYHNTGLDFYSQDFNENVLFDINNSNTPEQNREYTKSRLIEFINSPLMHSDYQILSEEIRDSIINQTVTLNNEITFNQDDFSQKQNQYFQLIETILSNESNITFTNNKFSNSNQIRLLNSVESQILNDTTFSSCQKLLVLIPLSVAKSSSMYWIEVINQDESLGKNWFKRTWNKVKNFFKPNPNGGISESQIVKVVSMDYLGAKKGVKWGGIFGGPKGALIGGIIGGIGGSAITIIKG